MRRSDSTPDRGAERLRIFLSSPGDVQVERERAEAVIRALDGEMDGVTLECVRWEGKPYSALSTFQAQIDKPSDCDLVVCIFWKRLGSELPPAFNREDGSARTGTEYEFEEALEAARGREPATPDIFVFRKEAKVTFSEERVDEERAEKRALDAFWRRWFRSEEGHFLAAFETFERTDQFARQFERGLRGWLAERFRRTDWDIATRGSPFQGLTAFDEAHAEVFFGRRRAVQQARAALMAAAESRFPALFVLGASGSGKSSLARAGLVPWLVKPDAAAPFIHALSRAVVTPAQLGDDLLHGLAHTLLTAIPEIAEGDHVGPESFARLMAAAPSMAAMPVVAALERRAGRQQQHEGRDSPPATGLILVLDQFEELFARAPEERACFAAVLTALVETGRIWLIATLRSDFYDALQDVPELYALRQRGRSFDLLAPSAADVREMILGPARAAGLSYEAEGERHLAELLEREVSVPGALPMLQYALQALFEARSGDALTLAEYDRLGGASGALAARAEAALEQLDAAAQEAMPQVLGQLASIDLASERAGAVARTTPLSAFAAGTPSRRLVDVLLRERLLLAFDEDERPEAPARLRIVHESLFERWPRAARQLAADRRDLDRRTQIERAEAEWRQARTESGDKAAQGRLLDGLRLAEGRDLQRRRGDLLSEDARAFVRASDRAAKTRGRRNWAIAGGIMAALAGLTVAAFWFAQLSDVQRAEAEWQKVQAERNLATAVDAANQLIFTISADVEQTEGVQQSVLLRIQRLAQDLLDRLTEGQDLPPEAERARGVSLKKSSDAALAVGDTAGALRDAEAALAIFTRLAASDPSNLGYQHDLSVTYMLLGDVQKAQGDLAAARTSYEAALTIRGRLAASDPSDAGYQRDLCVSYERIGDVQYAQGDLSGARKNYEAALTIQERLAASDPSNAVYQRGLSIAYGKIGDVQTAQGDLSGARKNYEAALVIRERLAASDPSNAVYQRDLSVSYERIGDVKKAQGDLPGARKSYEASLAIVERLAASDPSNAGYGRSLAISYEKIGDVQTAQGDLPDARKSYEAALTIRERLAASDPSNVQYQRDLRISCTKIGDLQMAQGDLAGARQSYEAALAISERLAASDPSDLRFQSDLSIDYERIGDIQLSQDDPAGALKSYEAALAIHERLVTSDPSNAKYRRGLSVSHNKIGDVQKVRGDFAGALRSYEAAMVIAERLAASDPSNAGYQRDLSVSYERIGDLQKERGDLAAARKNYEAAMVIAERLADSDPSNVVYQRDLSVSHAKLAAVDEAQGDKARAAEHYRSALAIIRRLLEISPDNPQYRKDIAWLEAALARLGG